MAEDALGLDPPAGGELDAPTSRLRRRAWRMGESIFGNGLQLSAAIT